MLLVPCRNESPLWVLLLQVVKYGVVGMPAFQQDLQHWSHLYVAGRLHKPVALLASHAAANNAYQDNLRAALSTALLLMPQPSSSLKVTCQADPADCKQHHVLQQLESGSLGACNPMVTCYAGISTGCGSSSLTCLTPLIIL